MAASGGSTASELRAEIDTCIESNDSARARLALRRLWATHRGPSQAGFVSSRWASAASGSLSVPLRLVVLRSFTLEPVVPVVRAGGALTGLDLDVELGGFNAYGQEILDPRSPLIDSDADAVILAVHTRDVAPDLWFDTRPDSDARREAAARVGDELAVLLTAFRERSTVPLVVHSLEPPPQPALGLADNVEPLGAVDAVRAVNDRLRSVARELSDVHVLDYGALTARIGRAAVSDERKWATMRLPLGPEGITALSDEWLRYLHPIAGRLAKVVVVDLDDTMWGGVLGEEGPDGVLVDDEGPGAPWGRLQHVLVDLRARGVLLAICSKNDERIAVEALELVAGMKLRRDDFHAVRINWQDKATNLREIAAELNVGVDSLAFVDDNPAERLLVEQACPEVTVIDLPDDPSGFADAVRGSPVFERLSLTDEDRRRSDIYVADRSRRAARDAAVDLSSYLASLGTTVRIRSAGDEDLARVGQLTRKTNQFNVTTRRYSDDDVRSRMDDRHSRVYVLDAADRFGDHGSVGVAMVDVDGPRWRIDTFLLSCRVIGRDVETALLARIVDDANQSGGETLLGEFLPTAKNGPARDLFERHGFVATHDHEVSGDAQWWSFDVDVGLGVPSWIVVE